MSAVFADDIYDSLDPISQMIEPFQCPVIEEIAKLPDEFLITRDQLRALMIRNCISQRSYINLSDLIAEVLYNRSNIFDEIFLTKRKDCYSNIFKKAFKASSTGQFVYNKSKHEIVSECDILVSKDKTFTESDIFNQVIETAALSIRIPHQIDRNDVERFIELADILNLTYTKSRRGYAYWSNLIVYGFMEKLKKNEWRIRSSEAIFDTVNLISHIASGDGDNYHLAKINLIHIKAIARNNKPIYKITEL